MDIAKLDECIRFSKQRLEKTCNERREAVRQFVGTHYGDNGADNVIPTNLLELATTIYLRLLAANAPKCIVSTDDFNLKSFAADMEIVLNQIPGEIRLASTIRKAVMEAMFSMGIVKVGITGTNDRPNIGDEPFVSLVQMDDYFVDMSARSWDEIQYEGNEYWMTVDDVKSAYGVELARDEYHGDSTDGVEQARSITNNDTGGELSDRVLLRDVYLPRTNEMVTYAVATKQIIRTVPWDGPEGTPYIKLMFSEVPGNLLPLPPVAVWRDLHDLGNQIFRKLAKQGVSRKTVATFQGGSDEEIARFARAKDGDAIRYNGSAPNEISVGGVDNGNLAFYIQIRDLFNIFAGNLDSLGGLSKQTDTAAQDKLINEAASARIQAMGDRTIDFAKDIFKRLAWYTWTDPIRERKFVKFASKRFNIGISKKWTPETRDGDFLDYNFDIAVFSMQDDSPSTRVQKLLTTFERFIFPMLQQFQEQGAYIDLKGLTDYIGRNSNIPELSQFIQFADRPDAPRELGQNPNPEYVSTKAPVTRRVYERVNRPGASRQGRDAVMMQTLLGGNPQPAEMASVAMGRSMA